MTEHPVSIRCAAWARQEEVQPAGSAPRCDVFVLVEHPLPWPSDPTDDPLLARLQSVAIEHAGAGRAVRLQAVAGRTVPTTRRVVVFASNGGSSFSGYGRTEGVGSVDELPGLVARLVSAPPRFTEPGAVTDVLLCTHGSRDSCCGSLGTRLWLELGDRLTGVRLWRTSHTGGHRFAPTGITFPDGNFWAQLDRELVEGIVTRQIGARDAAPHLRGCAAFIPAVQAADGAVLAEHGWSWLKNVRSGRAFGENLVELHYRSGEGSSGTYEVRLHEGRTMPVPDCGGDPADARKEQREFGITSVRLSAGSSLAESEESS